MIPDDACMDLFDKHLPTALKEIRTMSRRLIRILDATAPFTLVSLALFVGVAITGLGF